MGNTEEIWITKEGIDSSRDYKISNLGRIMKPCGGIAIIGDNGNGYKTCSIRLNNKATRQYVHRLVAQAFLPNPDNLPQVNHIDCNKENNCASNLEWISGSRNILHAHAEGRMKKRSEYGDIKILTEDQVYDLYLAVKRDKVGISEKARQMGIPRTTASSIINKRSRSDITDSIERDLSKV